MADGEAAAAYAKFDLAGRSALVTGGGTGLGYFMSRGLARSGARVMIAARREATLADAAARLQAEVPGAVILYRVLDLADRDSVARCAEEATTALDGVDILVGNAAQDIAAPVDAVTDAQIDTQLQVNLAANIALVRAFLPHMRRQRWGRIIFSSSVGAIQASAQTGMAVYSATKAALNSYARVTAAETGHDRITVNCLNLGMYHTDLLETAVLAKLEAAGGPAAAEAFLKAAAANNALGRLGDCAEVEGLVQLLASDAGSYITGADLAVDGGLSILMRPNPAG